MNHIISSLFGSLEVFSGLFLASAIFRIPYRSYLIEFSFISIIIGIYNTISLDIYETPFVINELIALSVLFLFHIFLLKFSLWFSFLMIFVGYITGEFILVLPVYLLSLLDVLTPSDLLHNSKITQRYQLAKFVIVSSLALLLYRYKIGVVFISEKMSFKPNLSRINILIIITSILNFFVFLYLIFHLSEDTLLITLYTAPILLSYNVVLWIVYLKSIKEHEEYYRKNKTYIKSYTNRN